MSEPGFQIDTTPPGVAAEIAAREGFKVSDMTGGLNTGLNEIQVGGIHVPDVYEFHTPIAPAACFAASVASCLSSGEIGVKAFELALANEFKAKGLMHGLGVTSPDAGQLRELNDALFRVRDNVQFVNPAGTQSQPHYGQMGREIVVALKEGNPVIILYSEDVLADHQSWGVLMGVSRTENISHSSWKLRQTAKAKTVSLTTPELAQQLVGTGNTYGARALILNRNMFVIRK